MTRPLTLGIATATSQLSVALSGRDGFAGSVTLQAGRRHGETLAPAVEHLVRQTGVALGDLEAVAVDAGPGLYTGLRVGVATAKSLAHALGLPVVACSSLEILAHRHRHSVRPVAAVVDARRGQVFWALFEPGAPSGGPMAASTDAAVADPGDLADELAKRAGAAGAGPLLVTGDGARRYLGPQVPPYLELAAPEYDHPAAAVLLDLASHRPAGPVEAVTPCYLRGADVRIGWEQR